MWIRGLSVAITVLVFASASRELGADPAMPRGGAPKARRTVTEEQAGASGDGAAPQLAALPAPAAEDGQIATLVQTHTGEHVLLAADLPSTEEFSALLRDRATGASLALDPRLLGLLQTLARAHPRARFELVSGFRSPKLNEMMRKKGHNVASHSQHSLGHAVDFRIVPEGATRGLDPKDLEREIRALGWDGGVGTYPQKTDWFVHADVGRNRHWGG
jgi:uncharacterized protein YcbK (DUF882 family)